MNKIRKNILTLLVLIVSIIFTSCNQINESFTLSETEAPNNKASSSEINVNSDAAVTQKTEESISVTTHQETEQPITETTTQETEESTTSQTTQKVAEVNNATTTTSSNLSDTASGIADTEKIEETANADVVENVEENATKQIVISFLGDCTLASQKGEEKKGNMINYLNTQDTSYFFEKCMSIIGNDDFTIANCENVFSDDNTEAIYKDYSPAFWFRSSTKNAAVYADSSIDAVSIANNHTNDYGSGGYSETKSALENVNVLWGDVDNPIILEKDGISIGIICCKFWGSYNEKSIIKQIEELSETTTLQIVFFHGGTEKIHTPEEWKVEGCRRFVDAGADLVIGGHPHVLQPYEEYNGTSIIYSIGNFCYGGNRSPENRTVIYQQIFTFDGSNNLIKSEENIIPFYVFTGSTNNWQPAPIEDEEEKEKVFDFLYGRSDSLF